MRVVAGTLGGQHLYAPKGSSVRPTPDRVREALFSALGDLSGAEVLDLYAGTGAISFEAISRGARTATLVEKDRQALATIARNIEHLRLSKNQAKVIASEVNGALARLVRGPDRFDLIFADPPYQEAAVLLPKVLEAGLTILAEGGIIVLEHGKRDQPPAAPEGLSLERSRGYGETMLAFYRRPAAEGPTA